MAKDDPENTDAQDLSEVLAAIRAKVQEEEDRLRATAQEDKNPVSEMTVSTASDATQSDADDIISQNDVSSSFSALEDEKTTEPASVVSNISETDEDLKAVPESGRDPEDVAAEEAPFILSEPVTVAEELDIHTDAVSPPTPDIQEEPLVLTVPLEAEAPLILSQPITDAEDASEGLENLLLTDPLPEPSTPEMTDKDIAAEPLSDPQNDPLHLLHAVEDVSGISEEPAPSEENPLVLDVPLSVSETDIPDALILTDPVENTSSAPETEKSVLPEKEDIFEIKPAETSALNISEDFDAPEPVSDEQNILSEGAIADDLTVLSDLSEDMADTHTDPGAEADLPSISLDAEDYSQPLALEDPLDELPETVAETKDTENAEVKPETEDATVPDEKDDLSLLLTEPEEAPASGISSVRPEMLREEIRNLIHQELTGTLGDTLSTNIRSEIRGQILQILRDLGEE